MASTRSYSRPAEDVDRHLLMAVRIDRALRLNSYAHDMIDEFRCANVALRDAVSIAIHPRKAALV
jgi:hypothetical protein